MKNELLTDDELYVIIQYRQARAGGFAEMTIKIDHSEVKQIHTTTKANVQEGLLKLRKLRG